MAWKNKYEIYSLRRDAIGPETFNMNSTCFIRKEHKCGKIFGASKSCFIACPTDDNLEPILELISEKLTKVGIEPIIAVKERAYGQDIFCTKICGKIIESKFCVVILDDAINNGINIPNPNVYYEYGLMTSLRKHIIPLQKEDLKLAFNIQSYDTVKYSNKNVATEIDRAIKEAIRITEQKTEVGKDIAINDKSLLRKFELAGLTLKEDNWFLSHIIEDTNFKGFGHNDKKYYFYLGKIDEKKDFETYTEDLDVVLYRTEKKFQEISNEVDKYKGQKDQLLREISDDQMNRRYRYDIDRQMGEAQDRLDLMKVFYVGFVINPKLDSTKFIEKVSGIVSKYKRYILVFNSDDELSFDEIKVQIFESNN